MKIELKNISLELDHNKILEDINLNFESGKIYGLKGKNGSGKTMLLRIISGLVIPTEGIVAIGNKILHKDLSFPESIGVLIESPGLLERLSGLENLEIIASIHGIVEENTLKEIMKSLDLDPLENKIVKKYSLGMRQKIGIAMAIMEDPDIVLLDEPLNALDEKACKTVIALLKKMRKRGAVIIIASHDKEELEDLADEIISIKNGKVERKDKTDDREKTD